MNKAGEGISPSSTESRVTRLCVDRATLLTLSRDDLIVLIEAQAGQIATLVEAHAQQIAMLTARIAELEAKLALPPKNPDNSSLPPSKGEKPNLPDRGKKPRPSAFAP